MRVSKIDLSRSIGKWRGYSGYKLAVRRVSLPSGVVVIEADRVPVVGRFAPSPTGPLHAGSLVAAMASRLDVLARGGRWLVRIEDVDRPRTVPGAAEDILDTLAAFGFRWDGDVVRQSERDAWYRTAFERLVADGWAYPCGCSRREVEEAGLAPRNGEGPIYPGTCRAGLPAGRTARAWRVRVPDRLITFDDRAAGPVSQNLARDVGDFVIRRADGLWAYQLAVVVDDGVQGVTDVVRGADLIDSTPRQRWLQSLLGYQPPRTLHVPLVVDAQGAKLSKQDRARPLDRSDPLPALREAAKHLELEVGRPTGIDGFWELATLAWAQRWPSTAAR